VAFGALLPEAAAGILLAGIVARRRIARTIEPVVGPGILADLRVGARSPEPLQVSATGPDGREVVGRPVENPDRTIRHRQLAHVAVVAGRVESDVVSEPRAGWPVQALAVSRTTFVVLAALLLFAASHVPGFAANAWAQPSIQTDAAGYRPGATVTISGAGWMPDEPINIVVTETNGPDPAETYSVVADSAGDFTNEDFVTYLSDVGLHFSVTATGRSSGYSAQTSFIGFTLNTAGISTDKEDYAPGEAVIVSGGGFKPNETVTLLFHRVNGTVGDDTHTTLADSTGTLGYTGFAPTQNDLGVLFILTATGSIGSFGQVAFTDSLSTDGYRTRARGNWSDINTWESAPTSGACTVWTNATLTPTNTANTITIVSGHVVHVTANVSVDHLFVEGSFIVDSGSTLTLPEDTSGNRLTRTSRSASPSVEPCQPHWP
jgi:hypothetical protein